MPRLTLEEYRIILARQAMKGRNTVIGDEAKPPAKAVKRIRQSSKPLLNKLETDFYVYLTNSDINGHIYQQAIRFKLGNGIWYKPDFAFFHPDGLICYEVKGPHAFRGGKENLKVAAHQFSEVTFVLTWKEGSTWLQQRVLP